MAKGRKMKKRTISQKGCRQKGHQFERDVAIALRVVFPKARRHLEYQDGEAFGVDIAGTGFYKFQCKRGRKYSSITAIFEIEHDAECNGDVPVLVTAGDHTEPMAVLPFADLLRLIKIEQAV